MRWDGSKHCDVTAAEHALLYVLLLTHRLGGLLKLQAVCYSLYRAPTLDGRTAQSLLFSGQYDDCAYRFLLRGTTLYQRRRQQTIMHKSCWRADNHDQKIYCRRFRDDIRRAWDDQSPVQYGTCIRPGSVRQWLVTTDRAPSFPGRRQRQNFNLKWLITVIDGGDEARRLWHVQYYFSDSHDGSWIIKFRRA